jgi:signal transduction histidine kinase
MQNKNYEEDKNIYKIISSELKSNPFMSVKIAFVVMGIIPLLAFSYIILGKNPNYELFSGNNAVIAVIAVSMSIIGYIYAYSLVTNMIKKLLDYYYERKRADDEKTELVIGVLHDLRTPLMVIKAGISNLVGHIHGSLNEEQAEIAERCLKSTDRLSNFINELRHISKEYFVRTDLKRSRIDLSKVVEDEISKIFEHSKEKQKNLLYRLLAADTILWADEQKMSIVVNELFSTILKYMSPDSEVHIILTGNADTVALSVHVNDMVWPDELGKIFHKYERPEEHAGVKGAGMNLSIVKDIVDLHSGHVTIKNETGNRVEFNIVLPRDLRSVPDRRKILQLH